MSAGPCWFLVGVCSVGAPYVPIGLSADGAGALQKGILFPNPERTASMPIPMKLGHSPDSDDAFMFYGLAENMVDSEGLEFEHILRDIQTLNEWARDGKLEC